MDINVKEQRWVDVSHLESGLFARLANARLLGRLPRVDVAARLHPDSQAAVEMKNHATRGDNEGRGRDVMIVLALGEGIPGPGETIQGQSP